MVAGSKRKSRAYIQNLDIKPLSFFVALCERAREKNVRDSCLVAMLYLTARRITELLLLKRKDITEHKEWFLVETINLKNYLQKETVEYNFFYNGRYYKKIVVPNHKESETTKRLIPYIREHIDILRPDEYVFYSRNNYDKHISPSYAYRIVKRLNPDLWLHYFRHQRFSQIAKIFQAKPLAMHDFTFHSRFSSTEKYIHDAERRELLKQI